MKLDQRNSPHIKYTVKKKKTVDTDRTFRNKESRVGETAQ